MNLFYTMSLRGLTSMLLGLLAGPLWAATFDFARLSNPGVPVLQPNETLNTGDWPCAGNIVCSTNSNPALAAGNLNYSAGGIGVSASGFMLSGTGTNVATVIQGTQAANPAAYHLGSGLGVIEQVGDDASIGQHEKLVLTFDQTVQISGFTFRPGNISSLLGPDTTFLLNGVVTQFNSRIPVTSLIGKTFTLAYGGERAAPFYLSQVVVTPIPEPEILSMMLAGLMLTGIIKSRRKLKTPPR